MQKLPYADFNATGRAIEKLICPRSGIPITRAIVLDHEKDSSEFLQDTALICRDCAISVVVLTVARSEDEAGCRQDAAVLAFKSIGLLADFDYVIGTDIKHAVSWAARWRNSPHVIVAPSSVGAYAWERWRHDHFCGFVNVLTQSPTLLTVSRVVAGVHNPLPQSRR